MTYQKRIEKLTQDERQIISEQVVNAIVSFLELFISPVIAKHIVCSLLIIAGVHSDVVTQLTGLHKHRIGYIRHQLVAGDIDSLLSVAKGRGRKSQIANIENQIIEEVENGNYQSLQQIVDMIQKKFEIKTSKTAVHRLLKKTRSAS